MNAPGTRLLLLGAVLVLGACSPQAPDQVAVATSTATPTLPTPATHATAALTPAVPQPAICPTLAATWVPADLTLRDRSLTGPGDAPRGVALNWANGPAPDETRSLSLLSGVGGEVGGAPVGRRLIRGHLATLLADPDPDIRTQTAIWFERPAAEPCHQYVVVAFGLTEEEFQRVLDGIR